MPVEYLSWNDCQDFVNELNDGGYAPEGWVFALPTEAQWEYVARLISPEAFTFGSKCNGEEANCNGNMPYGTNQIGSYVNQTTPVAKYSANAWGISDMHGNVWEWCRDYYGDYEIDNDSEDGRGVVNPRGPETGQERVLRGGAWYDGASVCRSSMRGKHGPDQKTGLNPELSGYGCRLVLVQKGFEDEARRDDPLFYFLN